MKKFRYKNLMIFGSLQFCGNIVEYFSQNSEKLIIYYMMPRNGPQPSMIGLYHRGKLVLEKELLSPRNFVFCYVVLYLHFVRALFTYFRRDENFFVICGHPLFSFLKSVWSLFRRYEIVYFVGDYYPGKSILNIFYRTVSHYYHNKAKYRTYLSDRLNKKYNGKTIDSKNIKTIMWGVEPPKHYPKTPKGKIVLCFIGAIRESHGLRQIFTLLTQKKDMKVKALGVCEEALFKKYQKLIDKLKIRKQVYFPNQFIVDLEKETADCHIGVALYTLNEGTYYADPGKVKAYAQLGLPILMTDAAQVAEFIQKFKAGEVVNEKMDSILSAIEKIQKNYSLYQKGLRKFISYFHYKTYYARRFTFLEKE